MDVPRIFYRLSDQVQKESTVTPETILGYLSSEKAEETFLPEVADMIGVEAFTELVLMLGGKTIAIPSAKEIEALRKG